MKSSPEEGIGASFAGARGLVAMKHVGLNVAADPLMTFSYTGVNGGVVIVVAMTLACTARRTSRTAASTRVLPKYRSWTGRQSGSQGFCKNSIGNK